MTINEKQVLCVYELAYAVSLASKFSKLNSFDYDEQHLYESINSDLLSAISDLCFSLYPDLVEGKYQLIENCNFDICKILSDSKVLDHPVQPLTLDFLKEHVS